MNLLKKLFLLLVFFTSLLNAQQQNLKFNEKEIIEKSISKRSKTPITAIPTSIKSIKSAIPDSVIADFISAVNPDSVKYSIQTLQNFKTRYAFNENRDSIVNWIKQKYYSMGFSIVETDSFKAEGTPQKNVIATLPGKNRNEVCIVGAHYDSYSSDIYNAPGADDNASGTALVFELARLMKSKNFIPECDIKFMNFAAEELGLYGSAHIAKKYKEAGTNVKLMINADMISYSTKSLDSSLVSVDYYYKSLSWLDAALELFSKFTKIIPVKGEYCSSSTDSYSFYSNNIQCISFIEYDFSPYYHEPSDTLGNYNIPYCAEIIKGAGALLLYASALPGPITNLNLVDVGDGINVKVSWNKSSCSDLKGYNIYRGNEYGVVDTTFTTTDTLLTLTGENGKWIFLSISVLTNSGTESTKVEGSICPMSIPPSPYIFIDDVSKTSISLQWNIDRVALMFAGYNVYRSDSINGVYTKLNSTLLKTNSYEDKGNLKPGKFYFYRAKTVYTNGTESGDGYSYAKGRLASLDQGIGLIITPDKNCDGSISNPSFEQVADFIKPALKDFQAEFVNQEDNSAYFSNIGAYSTVIWCNNSEGGYQAIGYSIDELIKYLKAGGKLLISSSMFNLGYWYPNWVSDSAVYNSGDKIFDYFKISTRYYPSNILNYLSEAKPKIAGYPQMLIDTLRIVNDSLPYGTLVEAYTPTNDAKTIYTYGSNAPDNQLNGLGIGLEYLGNDYKLILLNFPLYYMKFENVKELFNFVLKSKFAEPLAIDEKKSRIIPSAFALNQNYPNPFNPITTISYSLPMECKVKIEIFNILGQRVTVLFDNIKQAGNHHQYFNASALSSGVYFYSLTARPVSNNGAGYISNKKMLLIK